MQCPINEHVDVVMLEIEIVVRNAVPIKVEGWRNISKIQKHALVSTVLDTFDMQVEEAIARKFIRVAMKKTYIRFIYMCYKRYRKLDSGMAAKRSPYHAVVCQQQGNLEWLCDYFASGNYQAATGNGSHG